MSMGDLDQSKRDAMIAELWQQLSVDDPGLFAALQKRVNADPGLAVSKKKSTPPRSRKLATT